MNNVKSIPSLYVLIIAAVFFLIACATDFLSFYNGSAYSSMSFIVSGWALISDGNVAWLANLAFIAAAIMVGIKQKFSIIPAVIALLLSFDVYRIHAIEVNTVSELIYGYEVGFICWIIAMISLVIAACMQAIEQDGSGINSTLVGEYTTLVSIVVLGLFIISTVIFAMNDRRNANETETKRIADSGTIFKRGDVCSVYPQRASFIFESQKILATRPVELMNIDSVAPLDQPTTLLDWGIPSVRVRNYDYSYVQFSGKKILKAEVKKGDGVATLTTSKSSNGNNEEIRIALTNWDRTNTIFDQAWTQTKGFPHMCPDYSFDPSAEEEPRNLLLSTFQKESLTDFQEGRTKKPRKRQGKVLNENTLSISDVFQSFQNFNCPKRVGFMSPRVFAKVAEEEPFLANNGIPFQVKKAYYFLGDTNYLNYCGKNKTAYMYELKKSADDLIITVSKRSLNNFQQSDIIEARFAGLGKKINVEKSGILNIEEITNELIIDFYDDDNKRSYKLMTTLRKTTNPIHPAIIQEMRSIPVKDPFIKVNELENLLPLDASTTTKAEEAAVDLQPLK